MRALRKHVAGLLPWGPANSLQAAFSSTAQDFLAQPNELDATKMDPELLEVRIWSDRTSVLKDRKARACLRGASAHLRLP